MGREIRRVPLDWEHPKDEHGSYMRLYDKDYESAGVEWEKEYDLWQQGQHPDQLSETWGNHLKEHGYRFFWEWSSPPDKEYYRERKWSDEEAMGYQIYETISEGTPTSPVFATLEDMGTWLAKQGYSPSAVANFLKFQSAPSMMFSMQTGLVEGIESLAD